MRTPGSETIVVKPELIRLVRRGDSKKWQVHYKLDGIKTWFRRSSDTADVKAASAIACSGRSNTDPPCRFNIDPGRIVAFALGNCG
jgi:hypothetical protein